MAKAASRLETRRYAAYLGATTEFRKTEGITFDPATKKAFIAISALERGMEDHMKGGVANESYDKGGANDIRLAYNKCGAVYAAPVGYDPVVGSDYVIKKWESLVWGKASSAVADNACDVDGIASPDNLTFIKGYNTLIIGEDTDYHQNDAVWAYNLTSKQLTRIMTTPYGSESTGVYWYPNINGFAYLKAVVQHPYGESDQTMNGGDKALNRGYDGFIGPFPAMD
jgi:secreted PhoX family phosphatase